MMAEKSGTGMWVSGDNRSRERLRGWLVVTGNPETGVGVAGDNREARDGCVSGDSEARSG